MKKFWVVFIMTFVMMSLATLSYASNEISVYLNNEKIVFDAEPVIINNRTMVPMRKIFENLDASVNWNAETRTVKAKKGTTNVEFTIGSSYMKKKETQIRLDSAPIIYKDRTVVPVRAVAEALDCIVTWNASERRVDITTWKKGGQKTVKVSNATELLKEIGSNKKIKLTSEFYDLSSVNLNSIVNENIEKQSNSNNGFVIKNVYNMNIEGPARVEITDLYADVFRFENCGAITLKDLTIGHTKPNLINYSCEGNVVNLTNCNDVVINKCKLFGCGARGINTNNTIKLECNNTEIYECSYSGISLSGSVEANIKNTEIYNSKVSSSAIEVWGNYAVVELDNCKIHDIESEYYLLRMDSSSPISHATMKFNINNSKIYDNKFSNIIAGDRKDQIVFAKSSVEKNSKSDTNTNGNTQNSGKVKINITSTKNKIETFNDIKIKIDNVKKLPKEVMYAIWVSETEEYKTGRWGTVNGNDEIKLSGFFNEKNFAGNKLYIKAQLTIDKVDENGFNVSEEITSEEKEFYWKR